VPVRHDIVFGSGPARPTTVTTTTYYEIQLHETLRTLKHTLSETPRSRPAVSCTSVLAARSPRAPRATQRASKLWPPSSGARDGPFPWIPSRELSSTHFLRQPRPVVSGGVGKCTKTFVYPPLLQRVRQRCSTLPFPTSPPRAPAHTHALAGRPTRSRHPTGRHLLSPHRVRPDFFIFNSSFHGQRSQATQHHTHTRRNVVARGSLLNRQTSAAIGATVGRGSQITSCYETTRP
jgi:hypothetical protein